MGHGCRRPADPRSRRPGERLHRRSRLPGKRPRGCRQHQMLQGGPHRHPAASAGFAEALSASDKKAPYGVLFLCLGFVGNHFPCRSEACPRSGHRGISASFGAEAIAGKPRSYRSKPKPQAIKKHPAGCFF
ncbi:hypothetical protein EMIT0373P_30796 [Pseudomonas chlororaphis]